MVRPIEVTAFDLALRYSGAVFERKGDQDHPLIQWWLSLCGFGFDAHDEIPWCSAFLQDPFWHLRLPRSKSAAARSWLAVGQVIDLRDAEVGFDVVVLKRGAGEQPGPEILDAPGHVGLYAGQDSGVVHLLGGNQGNAVSVQPFSADRVIGVRRLYKELA